MQAAESTPGAASAPELADLVEPLRRFVRSLASDPHDVDDIVQETAATVLAVRHRLDDQAATGYAFAVARNLVRDEQRAAARRRRHLPRMLDRNESDQPEATVIALEERRALRSALEGLPVDQRDLMLAHDVEGRPLAEAADGRSAGAAAAQLGRARARLRLDYVLGLRRVELPTDRCRPVFLALSTSDRRRQAALRAGRHVVHFATCAELAPVLMRRERALAGLLPWLTGGAALGWLAQLARRRSVQIGSAATTAGVVAVTAVALAQPAPEPKEPAAEVRTGATLLVRDRDLLSLAERDLPRFTGDPVRARGVPVLDVPADEGFWVGEVDARMWVQLRVGGESRVRVRAGDLVSFRGTLVRHGPGFPDRVGVTRREGAAELDRSGHHVDVPGRSLIVR